MANAKRDRGGHIAPNLAKMRKQLAIGKETQVRRPGFKAGSHGQILVSGDRHGMSRATFDTEKIGERFDRA